MTIDMILRQTRYILCTQLSVPSHYCAIFILSDTLSGEQCCFLGQCLKIKFNGCGALEK